MSFNKLCPFYDLLKPVLSSCADVKQILNSDDVDHYSNSNNDNDDDDNGDEDEDEDESAAGNDGQIRHTHTHTHTHCGDFFRQQRVKYECLYPKT